MSKKNKTLTNLQKATKKAESRFTKFDIINLSIPEKINEDVNLHQIVTDYIPFGVDNLYPQYLAELKRQSSTHRSILAQKKTYSTGNGWNTENDNLIEYLDKVNPDESFRYVYGNVIDDYYSFGNAYIQVVKFKGGINLFHIDATKVRIGKEQENCFIHPDWSQYESTRGDTVILPLYPKFKGNVSVIQFKDYEPTFNYYGLPDYCACLEHIAIDFEIGKYNHTRFKNNFQPSAIVEINGDMGEKEAEELVKQATDKWTGAGKNGKILFIVKNGDTSPAQVSLIQDKNEGSWIDLQKITDQNIITAHRWSPSLSGVMSSGKLTSQGNEIRVAYELVLNTVIKDTERLILDKMKMVIDELAGLDTEDLAVVYEPPISFLSEIDPKIVLTMNEQREVLGFPPLEDAIELEKQQEQDTNGERIEVDENIEQEDIDGGN